VAEYGQIKEINGLKPRLNLQVTPYLLAGFDYFESSTVPNEREVNSILDIGGDIKLGFGSNIILDATINPDFDASALSSGVYFYTINTAGVDGQSFVDSRKMIKK